MQTTQARPGDGRSRSSFDGLARRSRDGLDPSARSARWLSAPLALSSFALLAWIFRTNLSYMVHVWWTDPNYSHGFLVPLISGYFALATARVRPPAREAGVTLGCLLLAASLLGRLATIVVPVGVVGDLSFVAGFAGILGILLGARALGRLAFPLTFLAFMIPLPISLYTALASPLQRIVSATAAGFLNAGGVPVLCEGNNLTLPGGVEMFVAEACSGMRQLTGFLALTVAVAFLASRPMWYRAVLVASAIPIALVCNVARVVLTGYLMSVEPGWAQGSFHTIEGLLMMGFGLAMLRAECVALDLVVPREAAPAAPGAGGGEAGR